MDDYYCVYYKGENLYKYKMNNYEKLKVEKLRYELINICEELDIPKGRCYDGSPYLGRLKDNNNFMIRFRQDIGYYVISGERGKYIMESEFPTNDKVEAKFLLLKSEFWNGGLIYELQNRKILKSNWSSKYNVEYDFRKAIFEYTLRKLKLIFETLPNSIIEEYTDYMNHWFNDKHWYFDDKELIFKEI